MECAVLKVDQDNRICLPQSLAKHAKWINGKGPLKAWLLLGSPGRCRLLSGSEVDNDPSCQSLRVLINEEQDSQTENALEFREEPLAALGLRLWPIEVTPPGPGWRFTLPKALAAIMQIHAKESSLALLLCQNHIELWTLETLRASLSVPVSDLI